MYTGLFENEESMLDEQMNKKYSQHGLKSEILYKGTHFKVSVHCTRAWEGATMYILKNALKLKCNKAKSKDIEAITLMAFL